MIAVCEFVASACFSLLSASRSRETALRDSDVFMAISNWLMRVTVAVVVQNDASQAAHKEVVMAMIPKIGLKPVSFIVPKRTGLERFTGKNLFPRARRRIRSFNIVGGRSSRRFSPVFEGNSSNRRFPKLSTTVSSWKLVTCLYLRDSANLFVIFNNMISQLKSKSVPFLFRTQSMCIIRYTLNFNLIDWSDHV